MMNDLTGFSDDISSKPGSRRIAHILPSLLPFGGVERLMITHATQYLARGFEVDFVFLNEPQDVSDFVPTGARIFDLHVPRLRHSIGPLVRYLRAERPDAVHAAIWPLTSAVAIARSIAQVPSRLVVSDHNPLSIQYAPRGFAHRLALRASIAMTYPLTDARVTVSGGVADDLAKLSGLSRERFTVIHNPISIAISEDMDVRAVDAAWRGWEGKRIITVGRLKTQKNHALLIRAFKRLLGRMDARLMILGVGELAEETAARVASAGLANKVLMPGQVDDPIPFYRSADLFVLSSDYEGFGNVIIEALACGLPVVSTDCPGGPAEILEYGRYGRLVPVGDEAALESAMMAALSEPVDSEKLKSRAADFAPGIVTEKYANLFFPDMVPLGSQRK